MQNDTHALLKLLKSDAHMQNHEIPFRYHFTPIRMVIRKKKKKPKCWQECGEIGTLVHFWWEYKMVQPLWKIKQNYLKKLNLSWFT